MTCSLGASRRLIDFTALHRTVAGEPFDFTDHPYLRDIYIDESPFVVLRKAAQVGASEYAISLALWFSAVEGGSVIYFFPTDTDVREFSQARLGPAIRESPHLAALLADTDNANLKKLGPGQIYLRGTTSRTRMKSVPADLLIFDELDEMTEAHVDLARKRLGHSRFGWERDLSTPSLPGMGVDAAFEESDQRHWLLACPACGKLACLEDEFLEHHGSPQDPRTEICFVKGPPGREVLICLSCGAPLDPGSGRWCAKYPGRAKHGYTISKFLSPVLSQQEQALGAETKAAALLRLWRETEFPAEFFNSELGLPYLGAEGGLTEADLLALTCHWSQPGFGRGCVMGVDQGNGLHVVIKEPHKDKDLVFTVRVHHEPMTDALFTHLDLFMEAYDVRACVIDALPNSHAARAFAQRFRGRVHLAYYGETQKGLVDWSYDKEHTPMCTINRTDAFDAQRDLYRSKKRRLPRPDDPVLRTYMTQLTNVLRRVREDPKTGGQRAEWVKRGPDHFAHADAYAEVALKKLHVPLVYATVIGPDDW